MSTSVRVSDTLIRDARLNAKIVNRSATGQIEHWAKIGKILEEGLNFTCSMVKEIIVGLEELEQGETTETNEYLFQNRGAYAVVGGDE